MTPVPSPLGHGAVWMISGLVLMMPVLIALAGASGIPSRRLGARRLALYGIALSIWLLLPFEFADPVLQRISAMISILGWFGLVLSWGSGMFRNGVQPLWAQVLVIVALIALGWLLLIGWITAPAASGT